MHSDVKCKLMNVLPIDFWNHFGHFNEVEHLKLYYHIIRLLDLIPKLGLQKGSVLRHMTSVVQPILEKGIVDHSIIHRTLVEYLSIADQVLWKSIFMCFFVPLK